MVHSVRERLTLIMSGCYSQEGSACSLHPVFQPQKAINEILSYLKSLGMTFKDSDSPRVICLCGSTRFTEQMLVKQWELTKQGFVVLSWCALPDSYFKGDDKDHIGDQEGVKKVVDEVHFRKIDLADEVLILNIGGYIGESTRNELNYAISKNKKVTYLEPI